MENFFSNIKKLLSNIYNKKYIRILICIFLAFYLLLNTVMNSINKVTKDTKYYFDYSITHNIKDYASLSQEKLETTYSKVINYIYSGDEVLLNDFNEREVTHMKDVYGLYKLGEFFTYNFVANFVWLYILMAKNSIKKRQNIKYFTLAWWGFIIFFAIVIILASFDFDSAFVKFHEIFFDNDLWLLDPKTDLMIRMLPQDYFMNLGTRIAKDAGFMLILDTIIITLYYAIKKYVGVNNV